jgi:ribosomal protein L30
MSKLTITQTRSQIKCPKRQKDTLKALGLGRIGKTRLSWTATPQSTRDGREGAPLGDRDGSLSVARTRTIL